MSPLEDPDVRSTYDSSSDQTEKDREPTARGKNTQTTVVCTRWLGMETAKNHHRGKTTFFVEWCTRLKTNLQPGFPDLHRYLCLFVVALYSRHPLANVVVASSAKNLSDMMLSTQLYSKKVLCLRLRFTFAASFIKTAPTFDEVVVIICLSSSSACDDFDLRPTTPTRVAWPDFLLTTQDEIQAQKTC